MAFSPAFSVAGGRLGVEHVLWRALVAYRFAALLYAGVLIVQGFHGFDRPGWALVALLTMAIWTTIAAVAYLTWRTPAFLGADLAVTAVLLLVSIPIQGTLAIEAGVPTLTTVWGAGAVLAWAIKWGAWRGLAAAVGLSIATVLVRGGLYQQTWESVVILLLAGGVVGYAVQIGRRTEALVARMVQMEAAARERERLARRIHDGVLQVLGLVERSGAHGGDPELARLAAEQQVALRALISHEPVPVETGTLDVRDLLLPLARTSVSVSTPSVPVPLPAHEARELAAATKAALDNVAQHVGPDAPAWVLVEDTSGEVVVTVRDEGPGVTPERLAEAKAEGRMGVERSMHGRIAELGGILTIHSDPGQGTEVEFRVPR